MLIHQTFFYPQVTVYTNRDTGERTIEIDFDESLCKNIPAYENDPKMADETSEWFDRVLKVPGQLVPTSIAAVVTVLPGEFPAA